jgi:hypothetical protein
MDLTPEARHRLEQLTAHLPEELREGLPRDSPVGLTDDGAELHLFVDEGGGSKLGGWGEYIFDDRCPYVVTYHHLEERDGEPISTTLYSLGAPVLGRR